MRLSGISKAASAIEATVAIGTTVLVGLFVVFVVMTTFPQPGYPQTASAIGIWKVDPAKSKFAQGANILALERSRRAANPKGGTFLVIANRKAYRATAPSGSGIDKVDYTNWKGMDLVQIGDKVRTTGVCGFRCQAGLPELTMKLAYRGVSPSGRRASKRLASDRQ